MPFFFNMHIWLLCIINPRENIIVELKKVWKCMGRKPKNKGQEGVYVLAIVHQGQTVCTHKGQEHCRYGTKDWATQRYCGYAPSKKMQLMGTKSKNDLHDNQKLNFSSLIWEYTLLYRLPTKVSQVPPKHELTSTLTFSPFSKICAEWHQRRLHHSFWVWSTTSTSFLPPWDTYWVRTLFYAHWMIMNS